MPFLKEDLAGSNYTWTNNASLTGSPSRRLFDRFNGNQVLFIINAYGNTFPKFTVEDGRKMEELIQNNLPMEAKSELSVFQWLNELASALDNKV